MSKRGHWLEMASHVLEEVVRTFAAVGTHDEITRAIEDRFGGLSDTVALGFSARTDPGLVREIVQDVRRIPSAFEGYATDG